MLEEGSIPTNPNILHVDCSADGLANRKAIPVFNGDQITLQAVRTCQQVFSAAFVGHVEHAYNTDEEKNALCTPVPHPNTDIDWLRSTLATTLNTMAWAQQPELQKWLSVNRLNFGSHFAPKKDAPSNPLHEIAARSQQLTLPAITKLEELLAIEE